MPKAIAFTVWGYDSMGCPLPTERWVIQRFTHLCYPPARKKTGPVTQEFHISVTPLSDENYLVRTERVAPGVPLAEEQSHWSVEAWLAQTHQLLNDPLLTLLQDADPLAAAAGLSQSAALHSDSSLNLVRLGQAFHNALFRGSLRDSWVTAQGIAHNRGETLRLRLGLRGLRLPRLPWEVLCETDQVMARLSQSDALETMLRPLTTGQTVLFSRYLTGMRLAGTGAPPQIQPGQPLRILMAIASPSDRDRLNLKQEALSLQEELRQERATPSTSGTIPEIQLTILEQPGREQLTQALEQGHYQVFHYAGHSTFGASGGNLYLVNRETGLSEILRGDDLAGLLVNNHVYMAVFNSCQGSFTAAPEPTAEIEGWNLAEALISRGVPAVLAMAERIPDHVALNLSRLFYRNLKQGYPIDLSLNRARQGLISSYGSQQLYWALPVLYMHPEFDGYLVKPERSPDTHDLTADSVGDRLFGALLTADVATDLNWQDTVSDLFDHLPMADDRELEMMAEAVLGTADDLLDRLDNLDIADLNDDENLDLDEELADDLVDEPSGEAIAHMVQRLSSPQPSLTSPPIPTTDPFPFIPTIPTSPTVPAPTVPNPPAPPPTDASPAAVDPLAFLDLQPDLEPEAEAEPIPEPDVATEPDTEAEAETFQPALEETVGAFLSGLFPSGVALPQDAPTPTLPQVPFYPPLLPNLADRQPSGIAPLGTEGQLIPATAAEIEPICPISPDEPDRETEPAPSQRGSDRWLLLPLIGAGVAAIALSIALIPKLHLWRSPTPDPLTATSPSPTPEIRPDSFSPAMPPRPKPPAPIAVAPPESTPAPLRQSDPREPDRAVPVSDRRHVAYRSYPNVETQPASTPVSPLLDESALLQVLPDELNAIASRRFEMAAAQPSTAATNLAVGNSAVKVLLDRNELALAERALQAAGEIDDPMTTFLRGRLAWMAVRQGYSTVYSVEDARKFWERAVAQAPDSKLYRNALAFAYYVEGKTRPDLAGDRWSRTIATLETAPSDCATNPAGCAIQALAWMQLSSLDPEQQQTRLDQARTLRNQVSDRVDLQPNELERDWLWREDAISEWRSLLDQALLDGV